MSDVLDHLAGARDLTIATLNDLDARDIVLRDELDELAAARTAQRAFLHDLDQLLDAHHPVASRIDPTYGSIDADIQDAVTEMEPVSLAQRTAIENTLQTKRDRPKPVVSNDAAPGKPPRKSVIDMVVVADWINAAKTDGTYSLINLAVAFDRPESSVKNWPGKCRQLGLVPATGSSDFVASRPPANPVAAVPNIGSGDPTFKVVKPRAGGVDLAEVARVVNEAQAVGDLPMPALSTHFNLPASTVKNWLKRARDAGLVNPSPKPNVRVIVDDPASPPTMVSRPPLSEIADTYREAILHNRRPIQTLIDRYDIDKDTADTWVAAARTANVLAPRGEPVVSAGEIPHRFVSRATY